MKYAEVKRWPADLDGHSAFYRIYHIEEASRDNPAHLCRYFLEGEFMDDYYTGYVVFEDGNPLPSDKYMDYEDQITVHGKLTCGRQFDEGYSYGFDCNHRGDGERAYTRDIDWLTDECESMGRQIVTLAGKFNDDA